MHVFPTTFTQFLRHPGAGCFVRSSAIRYDRAVLRYLIEMCCDLVGGHAQSVRQLLVRLTPRRWIPCVNKREFFATVQALSNFIRSDPRCLHSRCFHGYLHGLLLARGVPGGPQLQALGPYSRSKTESVVLFVKLWGALRQNRSRLVDSPARKIEP